MHDVVEGSLEVSCSKLAVTARIIHFSYKKRKDEPAQELTGSIVRFSLSFLLLDLVHCNLGLKRFGHRITIRFLVEVDELTSLVRFRGVTWLAMNTAIGG